MATQLRTEPVWRSSAQGHGIRRSVVHASGIALLTDLQAPPESPPPPGISTGYLVVLPYSGLFNYKVGSRGTLFDATSTLWVTEGQEAFDEHPVPGLGHASLIIRLARPILDELCGGKGAPHHPAFASGATGASARLRLLTHRLLSVRHDRLQTDELVLAAVREAMGQPVRPEQARAGMLVRRAKEYIHAHSEQRLSLSQVAAALGASPVYLTNEFARLEGIPLYRYQLQLRLEEALNKLTGCGDITELALDLGFSSHSHFTSIFRKQFGITPSELRRQLRHGWQ